MGIVFKDADVQPTLGEFTERTEDSAMRLIHSLEVSYFRSLYKQTISDIEDLTIFFGRNDSGKSNYLRALNLFFNGETNPGIPFKFAMDLCHARRHEADKLTNAKKFVAVKVIFNVPSQWKKSLGASFYVRKLWSITTGEQFSQTSSISDPSRLKYLTRFLNNIHFHYVPAIKDRRIFEQLLSRLYSVLSADAEFVKSLDGFAKEVQVRTSTLTNDLAALIGLASTISPPTDLRDLFRSLDFETRTNPDDADGYSLTLQRGDGVQVRHIPAILKFLADSEQSAPFHVWGFEEPENSLELASAIAEAEYFKKLAHSKNIQIFATSHSPAFFNSAGGGTKRFFVSRAIRGELASPTSEAHVVEDSTVPSELMGELPHLALISPLLKDADAKMKELAAEIDSLRAEIADSSQPVLFVEGVTDKLVFQKAWDVLIGGKIPFKIESCDGTSKMKTLAARGTALGLLAPGRHLLCLVDNDYEGRELYVNSRLDGGGKWVLNKENGTHWCRLQPTNEFEDVMRKVGIQEKRWPFVIEACFSAAIREAAVAAGAYALSRYPFDELTVDTSSFKKVLPLLSTADFSTLVYLCAPDATKKEAFAEWICGQADGDASVMEPLKGILEGARDVISAKSP
ncbi:MAG: AAA family ATPase [Bdellovibrionales bacterium]|nr:AAA family ATPase [Bdellovibrionales bacterium]